MISRWWCSGFCFFIGPHCRGRRQKAKRSGEEKMDAKIHGLLLIRLREQTTGVKAQSVSRQNLSYHIPMDIGKAAFEAVVKDAEAFVVEAE